jgi:hypothetical protein
LTVIEAFRVIVHALCPTQPPPVQPVKDPFVVVGVSVITEPTGNVAVHLPVHFMPTGELTTVPFPGPLTLTVRGADCTLNVAVTVVAVEIVTVQFPVPLHPPPPQLTNVDPADGLAVKVTVVPFV